MKKLFILLTVILLCNYSLYSQIYEYVSLPDSGAIWSEWYRFNEPTYPDTVFVPDSYERFTVNGEDTLINNILYSKVYMFFDTVFNVNNSFYVGGIREDSTKKIFCTMDSIIHPFKPTEWDLQNDEFLLYDFSLNIGDTMNNGSDGFIIVSDIDTVLVGGTLRKKYILNTYSEWIEGIGCTRGLLFTSGDLPINPIAGELICFTYNEEQLYFNENYSDCMPLINNIIVTTKSKESLIYPNPAFSFVEFKSYNYNIKTIKIINSNGLIIKEYNVNNNKKVRLDISNINSGMYLYQVLTNNGLIETGKLIIKK